MTLNFHIHLFNKTPKPSEVAHYNSIDWKVSSTVHSPQVSVQVVHLNIDLYVFAVKTSSPKFDRNEIITAWVTYSWPRSGVRFIIQRLLIWWNWVRGKGLFKIYEGKVKIYLFREGSKDFLKSANKTGRNSFTKIWNNPKNSLNNNILIENTLNHGLTSDCQYRLNLKATTIQRVNSQWQTEWGSHNKIQPGWTTSCHSVFVDHS